MLSIKDLAEHTMCENCGRELTVKQQKHLGRYCSRRCNSEARFGKAKRVGGIEVHSDKLLKAVKLFLGGATQTEAARIAGLHPSVLSRRLSKYDVIKMRPEHICEYCGAAFPRLSHSSNHRYCSKQCAYKAARDKRRSQREYRIVEHSPEIRKQALAFYRDGLDGASIAKHLNIAHGTVKYWASRYKVSIERRSSCAPELMFLRPIKARLQNAESADEWLRTLRESITFNSAPSLETGIVWLVCGKIHGQCALKTLATVVADRLAADPCNGEIFAFCDMARDTISTLQWLKGSFLLTKTTKTRGRYLWPDEKLGAAIVLNTHEFEFLLSC